MADFAGDFLGDFAAGDFLAGDLAGGDFLTGDFAIGDFFTGDTLSFLTGVSTSSTSGTGTDFLRLSNKVFFTLLEAGMGVDWNKNILHEVKTKLFGKHVEKASENKASSA